VGQHFAPDVFMPLHPATPAPSLLSDVLTRLQLPTDGRPVFLNFYRSDCPWSAAEMPRLSNTYARHPALEMNVIGIACGDDTVESAGEFARAKELQFPTYVDESGDVKRAFGIERVPAVVMVNAQGLVERTFEGVTEQLTGILEQTIYAAVTRSTPPEYDMIGNGCAA
jgi:peroxiredoxin